LVNPENSTAVAEIARRFGRTPGDLSVKIRDAEQFFVELAKQCRGNSKVEMYWLDAVPMYSYYRIDEQVAVWVFENQRNRVQNPVLQCRKPGFLWDFFVTDFEQTLPDCRRSEEHAAAAPGTE
jgi:hypothetical protein